MRLALVSMPWSSMSRPSAALGALAAFVKAREPRFDVETVHAYMHVARELPTDVYSRISGDCYRLGELIYLAILTPRKREAVVSFIAGAIGLTGDAVSEIVDIVARDVQRQAEYLASAFDVVGFTTCFGQLFANIAVCTAVKALAPKTVTILGGSTVSARVGPSILGEYPCVDFIVQGEGELPLLGLLHDIESGGAAEQVPGVLSRANAANRPNGVELHEVGALDELPIPLYDDYAQLAAELGVAWAIPVEGSRGCWWDRVKETNNPKNTCYFCNLNVQWRGYREKSVERVVREVDVLTTRYANCRLFFLDNIIRHRGVEELGRGLVDLEKDLHIFYEMRANVRPHQLLLLWEAGVRQVQFGIEALSSSLLKRIGKGTTVIQNLEAMKTCRELQIVNDANLIVNFPGTTAAEIRETVENIDSYASSYQPLGITVFYLGVGSTTDRLRDEFGITNVRNGDHYRIGLPDDVWERLHLLDLSYDRAQSDPEWSAMVDACERWRELHTAVGRDESPLQYEDGGTFLRIRDRRKNHVDHVLRGGGRMLYLFCAQIRSRNQIIAAGGERDPDQIRLIDAFLGEMIEKRLMYREGEKFLSLAVAPNPQSAARRIRAAQRHEEQVANERPSPAARRELPVIMGDQPGSTRQ
ncbi:RiPP maturation radical SAM C-methyltransferase [Pendulispora albinea]|uniref:RiPP maturation radical SAM C-methyltransferase n=1 Tax=Pendulispora albinea TaxID=2741071 RepID=A0ABZ2LY80_9BACT